MSSKFALIIGNTEYIDPGLAQLTAPGKDAEDFARVLKDQDLCAFDDVNILLNQPEYIVRGTIDEFFDQKKPDDLLVLYFSGHGVRDELGALYLAVKNTNRFRLRSTALKSDFIREAMDQSRSKRQVLILDCCNSGAFSQGMKAATGVSIGTATAFESGYGRIILTASDSTQFAWEGDQVIGETDNSLFTHYLIEGLEGEADLDSDGRITVDELYDYAYEKVKLVTPKQTPSKFSRIQQGEIVLRQNIRIEDIKPVALADDLISEIEDTRPAVREWAVQRLEKILKGKNIGLAHSAREALEKIAIDDNTTRRVSQMATQLLESILQAEKAEEERKAREEAERIAAQKAEEDRLATEKAEAERLLAEQIAEEERLAREKSEAERKAKEEAQRLAREKAKAERQARADAKLKVQQEAKRLEAQKAEERIAREKAEAEAKAKEEAQRLAAQKAKEERLAREKAEKEQKAKEESQRLAAQKAKEKRLATEKAEAERKAKEEAERDAAQWAEELEERIARAKSEAERKTKEKSKGLDPKTEEESLGRKKAKTQKEVASIEGKPAKSSGVPTGMIGIVVIALVLCGFVSLNFLSGILRGPAATELPAVIEAPATEVPSTEAPVTEAPVPTVCVPNGTTPIDFPASGKSATVGLFTEPDKIITYYSEGFASSAWLSQLTMVGLAEWDENGFFVPDLAAEIPTTENGGISPDGLTITWNLRPCLYWSDGEPITSADVKFTWDSLMDPANKPLTQFGYDQIESIETPDDLTIIITFNQLYPNWQTLFTQSNSSGYGSILPKHILEGRTSLENTGFIHQPDVSSGPFVITEWIAGDHITLLPNPNFYRGRANLDQVLIRFIPDLDTALAALQNDEMDLFPEFSETEIETLGTLEPNVHLKVVPNGLVEHYFFNLGTTAGVNGEGRSDVNGFCPFQDLGVRKAITLGINRQEIIDILLDGKATLPATLWPNTFWTNTNLQADDYDPDAAKALLDKAGYIDNDGDGIREGFCNGQLTPLAFNFETTTRQMRMDMALVVQSNLLEIGVAFTPIHTAAGTFFASYAEGGILYTGNFDMAGYATGYYPDPYTSEFKCGSVPNSSNQDNFSPYHLCDPTLESMMEKVNDSADPVVRKSYLDDVQKYIFENYYVLLMYTRMDVYGYTDRFTPAPFGFMSGVFWNAEEWDIK